MPGCGQDGGMFVQLLFDPILCAIVFAVVLVCAIGPAAYRPLALGAGVVALALLARLLLRRAHDRYVDTLAEAPPEDGWAWPRRMGADLFIARCTAFLRLHGWRVVESHVTPTGDAELLAQKDRARIVLHCLRPGAAADETLLAAVSAARGAASATRGAVLSGERPAAEVVAAASRHNVLVFRNAELESYEPLLAER